MKNKSNWLPIPVFILFCIIYAVATICSFFYNLTFFYIELALLIIFVTATVIIIVKRNNYFNSIIKESVNGIRGLNNNFLERFTFPVAVTSNDGKITWYNSKFKNRISNELVEGNFINQYINQHSYQDILDSSGKSVKINDRCYTVYATKTDVSMVFYYIDDTKLKNIVEEYNLNKSCIATVVFDNKEDFERKDDDSLNSVLVGFENILQKWANEYNALYKKISESRYLFVFKQVDIFDLEKEKFKILGEVRKIKSADGNFVTMSVGIGCGAVDIKEAELWSRDALDMALGRGGDQVVIKVPNNYIFYGGASKGVEKRDKVKTRLAANYIKKILIDTNNIYIMGHKNSDLDSIGAASGLYATIKERYGKRCKIVVNDKSTLAIDLINELRENYDNEMFISPEMADDISVDNRDLLIIVDTHSKEYIESASFYQKFKNIIIIDHHRMSVNKIENVGYSFHEQSSSSTSEMVTELVQYLGDYGINKHISEALLSGIMLDTKNFTIKTGVRTFEASSFLCRKGADTVDVKRLFTNSMLEYKKKTELVYSAIFEDNSAIAFTNKDYDNIRLIASQAADELLTIDNIDASYVIYPIENGVNISARSLGKINVQLIMEDLGGGGHYTSAATQIKNITLEEAKELLIKEIKKER